MRLNLAVLSVGRVEAVTKSKNARAQRAEGEEEKKEERRKKKKRTEKKKKKKTKRRFNDLRLSLTQL